MFAMVAGAQYGDEGKGKIISYLALADKPQIVARGGVGPNAGHQVFYNGKKYSVRQIPSGFVYEKARLLVGAGVLVNPEVFLKEVEETKTRKRVGVDGRCTVITQAHRNADAAGGKRIGTTGAGCGPANAERVARTAMLARDEPLLKPFVCDVAAEVNAAKNVLIEGTQGFMLSLLYGTYPFVTSKDTSASTIAADVGVGPTKIDEVIMVVKSYTTRVGNGPLKSEMQPEEAQRLGFQEYGTVTGRARRASKELHFDDLRYACTVCGATQLAITKLDVRFPAAAGAREYSKLPADAKRFIERIEKELGVPATLIGTGPEALDVIDVRSEKL